MTLGASDEAAWRWFSFHADQRSRDFRYFLVLVGLLVLSGSAAMSSQMFGAVKLVGLAGVLASALFFLLDVRNEELVAYGQDALRQTEFGPLVAAEGERRRLWKSKVMRRLFSGAAGAFVVKHRFIFRAVTTLTFLAGILIIALL